MNPRSNAPRIERRERGHHVVGRAERVVLVAVLDVGDAVPTEEPRVELDALAGRRRVDHVGALRAFGGAEEHAR